MNPPKPTAVRMLEGNPSRRPYPANEPKPAVESPDRPSHLDATARREWDRLVPLLLGMRVLTAADGVALASLCTHYSLLIRAQRELLRLERRQRKAEAAKRRNGEAVESSFASAMLSKNPNGSIQVSPVLSIIRSESDSVAKYLREFGLTPAARVRVQAEPLTSRIDPLQKAIGPRKQTA